MSSDPRGWSAGLPEPLALLDGMLARSPVPHAVFEVDGRCVYVNEAFHRMYGESARCLDPGLVRELGIAPLLPRSC